MNDVLKRSCPIVLIALLLTAELLPAQAVHVASPSTAEKIFAVRCAGCHGRDAHGTDQGPSLIEDRRLRGQSARWVRKIIRRGIPSSGMPAFNLPNYALDALATLVHSLNLPAADARVPGDRTAGEQYFFGKGQCASCHMVQGAGSAIGPDLSNVGRVFTVDELRTKLLEPKAHITAGYEVVTVKLQDGRTIRGFARSRSNFEIVVQDFEGQFHPLYRDEILAISNDGQSAMPRLNASDAEQRNLIAYLSRLTGVKPGVAAVTHRSKPGGIGFRRILHPYEGDWLTYNGELSGNRYSSLTQINATNVNRLELKWIFSVPLWKQLLPDTPYFNENMQYFGLEVTPVVADGIMYVTGPHSTYALDATTGREIWEYSRSRTGGLVGDAALGTNRGVALLGDKVFMVTDNAHLIALNRITGQLVWEIVMPDELEHYGSTVAPLAVKDMVIAGVSGGDWGMRGFIAAYKAATGERVWRHWTIPAKGAAGAETWGGTPSSDAGGATWLTGTYDPETDTLYWPTGNPYPDSDDRNRPGDNLFTNCILALDPQTGNLKWYYQFTPHDTHDWDAVGTPLLVDTVYRGQQRKLLLHADKNGFFYVLDRTNGQLLLAEKFVRVTWASGIGADGRPQLLHAGGLLCPEVATNWNAAAFSPMTKLYYLMAYEKCNVTLAATNWRTGRPPEEPGKKYLRALNIEDGKVVWQVPQLGPGEGKRDAGVLATAGGILVYGAPAGDVVAVDQRNGRELWHFPTNGENKASPIAFEVNGKQFIALAVGPNILCFGL